VNAPLIQILMVEDNEADVLLARHSLERSKVANCIHVVDDGVKAIEYLRRQHEYTTAARPDLILLDLNLPRRNGYEVLAEVKSDPELCTIPVVIMTCSETERDWSKGHLHRADGLLRKPVDFDGLMEVVKSIKHFALAVVTTSAA
jgi:two-component system, chemotaxis family, response regulator Rcp1